MCGPRSRKGSVGPCAVLLALSRGHQEQSWFDAPLFFSSRSRQEAERWHGPRRHTASLRVAAHGFEHAVCESRCPPAYFSQPAILILFLPGCGDRKDDERATASSDATERQAKPVPQAASTNTPGAARQEPAPELPKPVAMEAAPRQPPLATDRPKADKEPPVPSAAQSASTSGPASTSGGPDWKGLEERLRSQLSRCPQSGRDRRRGQERYCPSPTRRGGRPSPGCQRFFASGPQGGEAIG